MTGARTGLHYLVTQYSGSLMATRVEIEQEQVCTGNAQEETSILKNIIIFRINYSFFNYNLNISNHLLVFDVGNKAWRTIFLNNNLTIYISIVSEVCPYVPIQLSTDTGSSMGVTWYGRTFVSNPWRMFRLRTAGTKSGDKGDKRLHRTNVTLIGAHWSSWDSNAEVVEYAKNVREGFRMFRRFDSVQKLRITLKLNHSRNLPGVSHC